MKVEVPSGADLTRADRMVERQCRRIGLMESAKTSLKACPGSVHWHFKKEGLRGTLEVTYWPARRSILISVHQNRKGEWTSRAAKELRSLMDAELKGRRSP